MNLSELSTAELEYICKQVHLPEVRQYFQKNPRRFAEIRRGFRPEKLSDADTLSILVRHANKPFISDLLNHIVEEWMKEIAESIEAHKAEGEPQQLAVLRTIAESVFCHNCGLYFKLSNADVDEEYIKLFEESMSLIQQVASAQKALETEKANAQAVASLELDAAKQEITRLTAEVARHSEETEEAERELSESKEAREQQAADIASLRERLSEAEQHASEMRSELDHYRYLEQFNDAEYSENGASQYQHTLVGVITHFNGKTWVARLADIVAGELKAFSPDENRPHRFDNREFFKWENGPQEDGAIAIWNWKTEPQEWDASKDNANTEYNPWARIIEIVEIADCSSLTDLAAALIHKREKCFSSDKVLFICSSDGPIKEGLLCTLDDFDCAGDDMQLKTSVFLLPHYSVSAAEIIKLSGKYFYKKMNLGIPKSIFRVRAPYEVVKSMLLTRILTMSSLKEQGFLKKDAQQFRGFIKSIPPQTLIQDLMDAYACTEAEAQEFVEGFISHADTYLSGTDVDMLVLSEALARNPALVEKCKTMLSVEWEKDNAERLEAAKAKAAEYEDKRNLASAECDTLQARKKDLSTELQGLQDAIAEKQQFASLVEKGVSDRIEAARTNAAEFVSQMAFVNPLNGSHANGSNAIAISTSSHPVNHENCGELDDIDTFEEELTDNLMLAGYKEAFALEMAQAISFGICNRAPIIIGNNAALIAECLAATLGGKDFTEIFVSSGIVSSQSVIDVITHTDADCGVFLLHGVFDNYNSNLFVSIANQISCWEHLSIILMSLQCVQPQMLPSGIWDQAIFVDGDLGLENMSASQFHSFNVGLDYQHSLSEDDFRDARRTLRPFARVLSNMQTIMCARYLATFGGELDSSSTAISMIIVAALSRGKEDELEAIFHEQGFVNSEKLLAEYL